MSEHSKEVRIAATRLMNTLHDLYGHTFDELGIEAIRHSLEVYTQSELAAAQAENERLREIVTMFLAKLPSKETIEALMPDSGELGHRPYSAIFTDKEIIAALRSVEKP